MMSASPWLTCPTTSVVMKGGTSSFATIRPLNRPIPIPVVIPAMIEMTIGTPWSISRPLTMGQRAISPAIDRSMPRITMTMVMPTAQMPIIELWRTTFRRLAAVRKFGIRSPAAAKAATPRRGNRIRPTRWPMHHRCFSRLRIGPALIWHRAVQTLVWRSEHLFSRFVQVVFAVHHGPGVNDLRDAIPCGFLFNHCYEILHRKTPDLLRELCHSPVDLIRGKQVNRLVRAVDADDDDSFPVRVGKGLEYSVQHDIGGAEQPLHILVCLQHVFRNLHGDRVRPVARLLSDDSHAASLEPLLESVHAVVPGDAAVRAANDEHLALVAESLHHLATRLHAGVEIVGPDEGDVQVFVTLRDRRIHSHHGNACVMCLAEDRNHRIAIHRVQDDAGYLLCNQVLHLIHLRGNRSLLARRDEQKSIPHGFNLRLHSIGQSFLEVIVRDGLKAESDRSLASRAVCSSGLFCAHKGGSCDQGQCENSREAPHRTPPKKKGFATVRPMPTPIRQKTQAYSISNENRDRATWGIRINHGSFGGTEIRGLLSVRLYSIQ